MICLAAITVLTGCSSQPAPDPSTTRTTAESPTDTATASPTPTVDPATAQAETSILEAYRGYWTAKVHSYADPTKNQDPNLAHFADDKALSDAQATIFTLRSNGISMPGMPTLAPVVSHVELGNTPTAMINDCVDATAWQPIYTATGASAAAPGQSPRVVTESTAFIAEGQWRIRTSVAHRDQPC